MPFVDLVTHPVIVAQYAQGSSIFQYDIELPVKGAELQYDILGVIDAATAQQIMEARKAAFEAEQAAALFNPVTWINIGYVIDADSILYAYYQFKLPDHSWNPQEWSNYPTCPPEYTDVP